MAFDSRFHTTCCSRAGSPDTDRPRLVSSDVDLRPWSRHPRGASRPHRGRSTRDRRSCMSSCSLPATMRLMSSRSEMSCAWMRVLRATTSRPRSRMRRVARRCAPSAASTPRIAFNGVRSSCDTIATNSSLTRLRALGFRPCHAFGFEQPIPFGGARLAARVMSRAIFETPMMLPDVVEHRRHRQRDRHQPSVLGDADRLEVVDALAAPYPRKDLDLLRSADPPESGCESFLPINSSAG